MYLKVLSVFILCGEFPAENNLLNTGIKIVLIIYLHKIVERVKNTIIPAA
jgi:hypothetical protein